MSSLIPSNTSHALLKVHLRFCLLLFTFYFNFNFFLVKSHPTTYQNLKSPESSNLSPFPPSPLRLPLFSLFFGLSLKTWSFFHCLVIARWPQFSQSSVSYLYSPKPHSHLTTSRSACEMRWLKWFNILLIFLCNVFLHLHLD